MKGKRRLFFFLLVSLETFLLYKYFSLAWQRLLPIIWNFLQHFDPSPRSLPAWLWCPLLAGGRHWEPSIFYRAHSSIFVPLITTASVNTDSPSPTRGATLVCPRSAYVYVRGSEHPPPEGHISTSPPHKQSEELPAPSFSDSRAEWELQWPGMSWFLFAERYSAHVIIIHPSRSH